MVLVDHTMVHNLMRDLVERGTGKLSPFVCDDDIHHTSSLGGKPLIRIMNNIR